MNGRIRVTSKDAFVEEITVAVTVSNLTVKTENFDFPVTVIVRFYENGPVASILNDSDHMESLSQTIGGSKEFRKLVDIIKGKAIRIARRIVKKIFQA